VPLREAGAVILGKVVTTEFAATEPRGTRNPWDSERAPGGSSSGSAAAVACGIVPAALGTQVVGSILRPASFCGCVGFKPSVGGINRGGSYDYFSESCTGVLAASLEDAWLVAINISTRAAGDPGYPGLQARPTRRRRTAPGLSPCCKRPAGKSPRHKPGAPSTRRRRGSPAPISRLPTAMPTLRSKRWRTRFPTRQG
jgi:Asp-tRNA(Asn)/Glu-tRNA(Gln) amidotransferase A subunit family amidase